MAALESNNLGMTDGIMMMDGIMFNKKSDNMEAQVDIKFGKSEGYKSGLRCDNQVAMIPVATTRKWQVLEGQNTQGQTTYPVSSSTL